MKGYKAFSKGWICRDFQYEIGGTYELPEGEKLEMCKRGFHFCKNPIDVFGYYPMSDDTVIAEVIALGDIEQEGTKYVTNKIKIVKEFTREQLQILIRDEQSNTGHYNSGNYNSGRCNSGDYNSGRCNTGYYNSGHYNSGRCNSGNYNSGRCNSGDFNSGRYNTGYFNSGNFNSGDFNTNEPKMRLFNKDCDFTKREWLNSLNYDYYDLCIRIKNKDLNREDWDRIKAFPNFDSDIFEEITGLKE